MWRPGTKNPCPAEAKQESSTATAAVVSANSIAAVLSRTKLSTLSRTSKPGPSGVLPLAPRGRYNSRHDGKRPLAAHTGGLMQWVVVGMNMLYAALGVVLMFVSIRVFDRLTKLDLEEELQRGNIAVGIFVAALFLSIALIIGRAMS
jgi:putative membrane protein